MSIKHSIKQLHRRSIKYLVPCLLVVFSLFAYSLPVSVYAEENTVNNLHFTPEEQAWLDKHPEVSMIYFTGFPPFLMMGNKGEYTGILPEYAKLLSQQTGIHFRMQHRSSWGEAQASADDREADIIGAVTPHRKFTSRYHFTLPVAHSKFYFYGPAYVEKPVHDMADVSGKRVGYITSFRLIESFSRKYQDINFVPYQKEKDLINALAYGEIDFIIHSGIFEYLMRRKGIVDYKILLEIPELETNAFMAVRNDWPELTIIINKVLAANQEKTKAIVNHWLEFTDSIKVSDSELHLTKAEQTWIAEHPVLRVGFDPLWAPIEFMGDNGEPQGISIQYLQRLEEILGIKIEYQTGLSWTNAYQKLIRSELDILPSVSASRERRQHINFTEPYLSMPIGIFSAIDRAYLGGLDALSGKRVIVVAGSAIQNRLESDYPTLDLITAPTIKSALNEVASGRAYALVGNLVSTSYYIGQSGLSQIRVVGETSYTNDLSMAVRKDWSLLPRILQKAIHTIPQSERAAIYNDWISIQYKHSVDYTVLWQILGGVAFILLITGYWIRRLSKEITQRRKIETALNLSKQIAEDASQKAQQATKVKSDFLTNMSHEIRTPMNAVIGASHLLRQTSLSAQQQEYLNKMAYSSEALLGIIDDILDFSKGDAGKLKLDSVDFSLGKILQKIKQTLDIQATQKGLRLIVQLASNVPDRLVGDPNKLSQILRNLTSNAIKYTKQGQVEIDVDLIERITPHVRIRFTIKDTGPGISPEIQKQLFKPFSQGDMSSTRQYGGTGLGLVISQQLARLMGSDITLDSKPGKGSTFSFVATFDVCELQTPLKSKSVEPVRSGSTELITPQPELVNTRILLIEDDDLNQFFEKKILLALGTKVAIAANGKKALQMLRNEPFDIILMDIQMPVMDGYETTQMIRREKQWRTLPIIALTAHALSGEREKCLAVGMDDYLSKPFEPEQLQEMLVKWSASK